MSNTDRLTYLQLTALKGEMAMVVSTSAHDAEIKYRFFILLKESPKELRSYIIEAMKDAVTFNEEEVDRIMLEVDNKQIPIWLWIEKAMADIRVALGTPDSLTGAKVSVNKKEQRKHIVTSAFIRFVRSAILLCPASATRLCQSIMEEHDFEFLHTACFELLQDIEEFRKIRPPKSLPNPSVMELDFDIRDLLSFRIEKESLEEIISTLEKPKRKRKKKIAAVNKESYKTMFIVKKTFCGSHISTVLKSCETEEEAIEFVRKIEKDFPEIKNTCTLEIIEERTKA